MENKDSDDKIEKSLEIFRARTVVKNSIDYNFIDKIVDDIIDATTGTSDELSDESPSAVIMSSEDCCDIGSRMVISSEENEVKRYTELVEARSFEILDEQPNLCSTPGPKGKKSNVSKKLFFFSKTRRHKSKRREFLYENCRYQLHSSSGFHFPHERFLSFHL